MYWRITEDLLWEEGDSLPSRVGWKNEDPNPQRTVYNAVEVRLLDDDREHYYTAICEDDDESLESLYYFAMRDAGVTIIQARNDKGEWEDIIG